MISSSELNKKFKNLELEIKDKNNSFISILFDVYDSFERIFELSFNYFSRQTNEFYYDQNRFSIGSACIYKSLMGIYNVIDCNVKGRVGLSSQLLRQILEFLIMGKAAILDKSNSVIINWIDEKPLNIQRNIFDNLIISKRDVKSFEQFKHFFKTFNTFVHSSRASQQMDFSFYKIEDSFNYNIGIVLIIFQLLYHFMFGIFLKENIKFIERYLNPKDFKKLYFLKNFIKTEKRKHTIESKRVEYFFSRKWKFKEINVSENKTKIYENYTKEMSNVQSQAINDFWNQIGLIPK